MQAIHVLEPAIVTVHTCGGRAMLEDAKAAAAEGTKVVGVTMLTSMDQRDLDRTGVSGTPHDHVMRLAELAQSAGLDGIVCSGQEVASVHAQWKKGFFVVPGLRPVGAAAGDQKRVVTPRKAARRGQRAGDRSPDQPGGRSRPCRPRDRGDIVRPLLAAIPAILLAACIPGEIHAPVTVQESRGADVCRFGDIAFREIAPGIWQHTTYLDLPGIGPVPSNGLLVVDGEETLLVDTAWTDAQTAQVLAWADGVLGKPVRAAIVTHAHKDKMGGIAALHRADIATFAHPMTNADAPANGFEPARHTLDFADDGFLTGAQAENFSPLVFFYPGGAHTRDNITVGIPAAGLAFGGCMIKGRMPKRWAIWPMRTSTLIPVSA